MAHIDNTKKTVANKSKNENKKTAFHDFNLSLFPLTLASSSLGVWGDLEVVSCPHLHQESANLGSTEKAQGLLLVVASWGSTFLIPRLLAF